MKDVSIIIVNYYSLNLVCDCIHSILKFTKSCDFEIIVVDNNSQPECNLTLKSTFGDVVKCIQLKENVGFGCANNEGVKKASGRNILFLNPDTILINDAISIMVNFLDSNERVGACGGNLYDSELKPTRSYRCCIPSKSYLIGSAIFGRFYEKIRYGKSCFFNYTCKNKSVSYIVGADLLVRKKVLDEVGLFNPLFFMYYEEIELCCRIRKANYDIINLSNAKIQHLEGKSTSNIEWKARQHFMSSKQFYILVYSKKYKDEVFKILKLISFQRILIASILNNKSLLTYWNTFIKLLKNGNN